MSIHKILFVLKYALDSCLRIILGAEDVAPELVEYSKNSGLPVLPFNAEALQSGSYIDDYNSFYDNL